MVLLRVLRRLRVTPEQRGRVIATVALAALLAGLLLYERLLPPSPGVPAEGDVPVPAARDVSASAAGAADPTPLPPAQPASAPAARPSAEPTQAPARPEAPEPSEPARPVPGNALRGYEVAYSPTHRDFRLHAAVDLAAPVGSVVVAAWSGKVVEIGEVPGVGPSVVIEHAGGRRTVYAPLADLAVSAGAAVRRGQPLGKVGSPPSGEPGLPAHLHFELHQDGRPVPPPVR